MSSFRVLYLHQFFVTREGVGGTRSYEFARRLVQRGHEVTIVSTAPTAPRLWLIPRFRVTFDTSE